MKCCGCGTKVQPHEDLPHVPVTVRGLRDAFGSDGGPLVMLDHVGSAVKLLRARGIAVEARAIVWTRLLGVVPWDTQHEQTIWKEQGERYAGLQNRLESAERGEQLQKDLRTIENDIPRTFKLVESNQSDVLERVLKRFACEETNVGYFQGMNDLAGVMIRVMGDELKAFCCFEALVNLMGHFTTSFPSDIWRRMEEVVLILEKTEPELLASLMKCMDGSSEWVWLLSGAMLAMVRESATLEDVASLWEASLTASCGWHRYQVALLASFVGRHKADLIQMEELPELVQFVNGMRGTVKARGLIARADRILHLLENESNEL